MSNWFKKISQEQPGSRWSFSIEADVWIPKDMNEEREKSIAIDTLRKVLNRVEGDTSAYTAIDSNVKFEIKFEPLKIK